MVDEPGSTALETTSAVHARRSSWGGPSARSELRRLAEDARLRAGFEVSAVEVLRADGFLELVAFCGPPEDRASMGGSFSLNHALRVLREGSRYGSFVFLPEEEMAPDLQEAIRGYGYVPSLPTTTDPDAWHSLDMLMAHVTDDSGRTRALLHLDEPVSGRRPRPDELVLLASELDLLLRALLTTVDREDISRQARLDETARDVVRAASRRLPSRELIRIVRPSLLAGFRASSVQVHLLDDPSSTRDATTLPDPLRAALFEATGRCWHSRTVVVAEPGHVWGDERLDLHHRDGITRYLGEREVRELLAIPVGAGHEPMGMLVVLRDGSDDRWTEGESAAALGVGHDLGRALLSTRAHEREQQLIAELRRLDRYRQQMISTVAHELRNPLGVIAGHVEILEGLSNVPEGATRSLQALHRSADRLSSVVEDLLLLGRVGNPGTPRHTEPVDLAVVVAEVAEDEAVRARHRRIEVLAPAPDSSTMVDGDPEQLRRLVANVVGNAVKYSHDGGIVELALECHGDRVTFTCADHGLGIAETDLAHLFDEFFRSEDPDARSRPGSGLGLAIVARIVERHGGHIDVDSSLGRGTTCAVTLPVPGTPGSGG